MTNQQHDDRLVPLDQLISEITTEIEERSWANPDDPRLDRLHKELQELKKERDDGIRYRPNF